MAVDSTKLTAVNEMLVATGYGTVLALSQNRAARTAEEVLDRVNESVQGEGWHFNRVLEKALEPDGVTGEIVLPTDTLAVRPSEKENWLWGGVTIAIRDGKLYDMREETYVFTSTITVDQLVLIDVDQLPPNARDYVVAKASRMFQMQSLGDLRLNRELRQDELEARHRLLTSDADAGEYTCFDRFDGAKGIFRGSWAVNPLVVTGGH